MRVLEPVWIPMADGCQLRARVWLPRDSNPAPAVLEYLPYRLSDFTARRDATTHPVLAEHGIAGVRVDMRGSGDSDGLLHGEYLLQEQQDALEVIAWIAEQPWCDGTVGMMGISWGGFNALQVAALRPPALRGIVSVCSTDDRYADDVHYLGGCLLNENLSWASTMLAYQARPPDPAQVDDWRNAWRTRLENLEPWVVEWTRRALRDEFWKHGSVCEDYAAIKCPVWAVGGWADGYSNAVFRLMRGLRSPVHATIGPWAHAYPHIAKPTPTADFMADCVGFFRRALRGETIAENGSLTMFVQDSAAPRRSYDARAGRWLRFEAWPDERVRPRSFGLGAGVLATGDGQGVHRIRSSQTVGLMGPVWCAFGRGPELADDQSDDDAGSLVFDGDPLVDSTTIVGAPVVELELTADRPVAFVAARLCDVGPDGRSTLVSFGALNLTHDGRHERVVLLEPDVSACVRLKLNEVAYRVLPGHRIRLSLSTTMWPMLWPSPEAVELTIHGASSTLQLPIFDETEVVETEVAAAPERYGLSVETLSSAELRRDRRTMKDGTVQVELEEREHVRLVDTGRTLQTRRLERYSIHPVDPLSARARTQWEIGLGGADFDTRVLARAELSGDREAFHIRADIETFEDGEPFVRRNWVEELPRHGR